MRLASDVLQRLLLTTTIEVTLDRGSSADSLAPLPRRRPAALGDRLAAEPTGERPGVFAAILLDRALSSEPPLQLLITLSELKLMLAREARERRRRSARASVHITVLVTALALTICVLADAPARLTIGVAISVPALGIALSLLAFVRSSDTSWPLETLIVGLVCEAGLGAFLIVEGARNKALVGDEVATLIGIATVGIPLILKAVVGQLQKR
jgi:hypothetical protein